MKELNSPGKSPANVSVGANASNGRSLARSTTPVQLYSFVSPQSLAMGERDLADVTARGRSVDWSWFTLIMMSLHEFQITSQQFLQ